MKIWPLFVVMGVASALNAANTASPYESQIALTPEHPIDKIVLEKLAAKGIKPSPVCSDAVFVRRVYLDTIGMLPTLNETKQFLQDNNPKKREQLIEKLLAREEFADYWAMKWGDVLRIKSEFPINLWPNAAEAYYEWVRTSLRQNKPYDQFTRELLTTSGSNFRDPAVNFYRALQNRDPDTIARAVALTFMGVRLEKWPKDKSQAFAAFFSHIGYKNTATWKEEIIFHDLFKTTSTVAARTEKKPIFPDGTPANIPPEKDPREAVADWLTKPGNAWFAPNAVNRIWFWLLGRGIVNEPDDFRADNPPQNAELLAYLSRHFIQSNYDLKQIYRLILNSKTYQLSSIPVGKLEEAQENFACYTIRRLDAEVLADALYTITGVNDEYSSLIPEPFTFVPRETHSIALPDGSITSSFLEMFGKPSRDTGLATERNLSATAQQRLHMLNSSHVRNKLERSQRFWNMIKASGDPKSTLNNVYLTILSRPPTNEEGQVVYNHSQTSGLKGRDLVTDVAWSLMNTTEFLYRH